MYFYEVTPEVLLALCYYDLAFDGTNSSTSTNITASNPSEQGDLNRLRVPTNAMFAPPGVDLQGMPIPAGQERFQRFDKQRPDRTDIGAEGVIKYTIEVPGFSERPYIF